MIEGDARVNEPSLKAREIEALVYVFSADDRTSPASRPARSRVSVRSPVAVAVAIAGLALLGTLVRRLFLW